MARFRPKLPVRSSTVIIALMYVTVVGYVVLDTWMYLTSYTFLPMDATALVGACFVAETVSLARLRMAKEQGRPMPAKADNPYLAQLGASGLPDFEPEVQDALSTPQKGDGSNAQ